MKAIVSAGDHQPQGEIGPDLFRHACMMGLEGLVSKHRESTYRGGRSPRWIKVNPAFARVLDLARNLPPRGWRRYVRYLTDAPDDLFYCHTRQKP